VHREDDRRLHVVARRQVIEDASRVGSAGGAADSHDQLHPAHARTPLRIEATPKTRSRPSTRAQPHASISAAASSSEWKRSMESARYWYASSSPLTLAPTAGKTPWL